MFKTGDFSKIAQVSARLLRYYDDIGLFSPAHIDRETGYRYYTVDQLPRLNQILALRDLGLSLDQIRAMLVESVTTEQIRGMLRLQKIQLEQSISEQTARLHLLETRLEYLEHNPQMTRYDVVIKPVPPQLFLSIHEVTPMKETGAIFYDLFGSLPSGQVKQRGPCMAIFYDAEFDIEQIDWEIGFLMSGDAIEQIELASGRKLHLRELPALDNAASTVYPGRWTGLHLGYSTLGEWVAGHGYHIQGDGREIFHKMYTPDEAEKNVTEIVFPVKKIE